MTHRILLLVLCLFSLLWTPQSLRADEPTLDQTVEWLKERLIGNQVQSICHWKVTSVRFKEGWLYIEGNGDCGLIALAVAFGSLDAQALTRLEQQKEDQVPFALTSTGKWPIQREISHDQGASWKREQVREFSVVSGAGRETALKLAKAFDHAARISGGGQKDLF